MIRAIGWLIGACLLLAALRLAAGMFALAVLLAFIIGIVKRPRETLAFSLILVLSGLIQDRPATLVAIVGVVMASCLAGKILERLAERTP